MDYTTLALIVLLLLAFRLRSITLSWGRIMKPLLERKFVSATELAKVLGVHRSTIQKWAASGEIPCVRLGARTVRFDPEEVQRAVDGRREKGS